MLYLRCKECGGDLKTVKGTVVCTCESCGRMQTLPRYDGEKLLELMQRADTLRRRGEFDLAGSRYEELCAEYPSDAELYWLIALCRYGIEYVEEQGSRRPVIHRMQLQSILEDGDYLEALKYSTDEQRKIYEAEASRIDAIYRELAAIGQERESFDVFLCCGSASGDRQIAEEIYGDLGRRNVSIFYPGRDLNDVPGHLKEAYIYNALRSAQLMIVAGSSKESFQETGIKNQWSRFLKFMENDRHRRSLLPVYRGMEEIDLPEEFLLFPGQDISENGALQEIRDGVEKLLGRRRETESTDADSAVREQIMRLLDEKAWGRARQQALKLLEAQPEDIDAHMAALLADARVSRRSRLGESSIPLEDNGHFQALLLLGDEALKAELEDYAKAAKEQTGRRDEKDTLLYRLYAGLAEGLKEYKESALKAEKIRGDIEQIRAESRKSDWSIGDHPHLQSFIYILGIIVIELLILVISFITESFTLYTLAAVFIAPVVGVFLVIRPLLNLAVRKKEEGAFEADKDARIAAEQRKISRLEEEQNALLQQMRKGLRYVPPALRDHETVQEMLKQHGAPGAAVSDENRMQSLIGRMKDRELHPVEATLKAVEYVDHAETEELKEALGEIQQLQAEGRKTGKDQDTKYSTEGKERRPVQAGDNKAVMILQIIACILMGLYLLLPNETYLSLSGEVGSGISGIIRKVVLIPILIITLVSILCRIKISVAVCTVLVTLVAVWEGSRFMGNGPYVSMSMNSPAGFFCLAIAALILILTVLIPLLMSGGISKAQDTKYEVLRILRLFICILMGVGLFLPFLKPAIEWLAIPLIRGTYGVIILLLIIPTVVLIFLRKRIPAAILSTALIVYTGYVTSRYFGRMIDPQGKIGIGIGFYLIFGGNLILALSYIAPLLAMIIAKALKQLRDMVRKILNNEYFVKAISTFAVAALEFIVMAAAVALAHKIVPDSEMWPDPANLDLADKLEDYFGVYTLIAIIQGLLAVFFGIGIVPSWIRGRLMHLSGGIEDALVDESVTITERWSDGSTFSYHPGEFPATVLQLFLFIFGIVLAVPCGYIYPLFFVGNVVKFVICLAKGVIGDGSR